MALSTESRADVSLDTNVISLLTSGHENRSLYWILLGARGLVLTYFVQGEVLASDWRDSDPIELRALLRSATYLQPPEANVINHFALLKRTSVQLVLRYGTEREDLWMLAQSKNHGHAVVTADRNAARVAKACDMEVLTALKDIERDYARDRRRLARLRSP